MKDCASDSPTRPRRWVGLLVFLFTLAVGLLLAEGVLRLVGLGPPKGGGSGRGVFWEYDPLLGWRHRAGASGEFRDGDLKFHVALNSRGLRDAEHAEARTPGRPRALVLGDSFAWGFGVEQPARFSDLLEKSIPGAEIVNAGVCGYGTDQEFLWLREKGMAYAPDVVLLVLCGNDPFLDKARIAYGIYGKPVFVPGEGGALKLENVPVPPTPWRKRFLFRLRQSSALACLADRIVRQAQRSRGAADGAGAARPFEVTLRILENMRDLCRAKDVRLLILSTGIFWDWDPRPEGDYARFVAEIRARGFDLLDIDAAPGYAPDRMTIPGDGHWNEAGHRFVAEQARALLLKHGFGTPATAR